MEKLIQLIFPVCVKQPQDYFFNVLKIKEYIDMFS